jgi:hypothetical protein
MMKKLLLLVGLMMSSSVFAMPHGNPASIYCVNHGGKSVIVDGQGYCRIPNGSMCDEWAYQRGECGSKKPNKYTLIKYCRDHKGNAIGSNCHFEKQGTDCNLNDFFNGTCKKHQHHKHPKVY